VSDIEFEDIPGLPGKLPPGEYVVWQGRSSWRALARHTFKVRAVAAWLGAFSLLRLVVDVQAGQGLVGTLIAVGLSALCLGILVATAVAYARSTIYTITSRRIVMRIGVAVPMSINVPFTIIAAADLRQRADCGDIVLQLSGPNRIAWLNLWPHVTWGQFSRPRPTLLSLTEAAKVASTLRETVARWAEGEGRRLTTTTGEAVAPVQHPVTSPLGA
jgi:hypothetical protein